ncbi:MAG: DUF1674 domain-containing protein [Alphaproteobacteria bacterium]|nr:DUF1674 domain-containing protein [Alphaproteobacteria bacterium]
MNSQDPSPAKPKPSAMKPTPKVDGYVPQVGMPPEHGGRKGPEATRYGDWENGGKCVDF